MFCAVYINRHRLAKHSSITPDITPSTTSCRYHRNSLRQESRILEKVALFEKLAAYTLQLLEQQLRVRQAESDTAVFSPGDITVSSEEHYTTHNGLEPRLLFGEIRFPDGRARTVAGDDAAPPLNVTAQWV
jgi:hypothetical protein